MKNANSLPEIFRPTPRDFSLNRQFFSDMIFDRIVNVVELYCTDNDLTRKDLAELMGRHQSQITRWLNSPSNWELSTAADFLTAVGKRGINLDIETISEGNYNSNHKHDFVVTLENTQSPRFLNAEGMVLKGIAPAEPNYPQSHGLQVKKVD